METLEGSAELLWKQRPLAVDDQWEEQDEASTPTFFLHDTMCPNAHSHYNIIANMLKSHPKRVHDEAEATLSLLCWAPQDDTPAYRTASEAARLPPRTASKPYVVWIEKMRKGTPEFLLARSDVLIAGFDLRERHLWNDTKVVPRGITYPPPKYWTGQTPDLDSHQKYFLTFVGTNAEGNLLPRKYGPRTREASSTVRPDLKREFAGFGQKDVLIDFDKGSESLFRERMAHTSYALVPHGRVRWSYRFSEAVGACVIPVLMADGLDMPFASLIDWKGAAVRIPEDILTLPDILPKGWSKQWNEIDKCYYYYHAGLRIPQWQNPALPKTTEPTGKAERLLALLPNNTDLIQKMRRRVCDINTRYFASPAARARAFLRAAAKLATDGPDPKYEM